MPFEPVLQANSRVNTGASSAQSENSDRAVSPAIRRTLNARFCTLSSTRRMQKQSSRVNSMFIPQNSRMPPSVIARQ